MPNRTTAKQNIVTKNVPSVSNEDLNVMMNSYMADNVRFRADVSAVVNSSLTNITLAYNVGGTIIDRIDLTRMGGNIILSVSGIEDGEEKYVNVVKSAGNTIAWNGVTDVTELQTSVTNASAVVYRIIRKGSIYTAEALIKSIIIATQQEYKDGVSNEKILTPASVPRATETTKGDIVLASDTDFFNGTEDTKALTSKKVRNATTGARGVSRVSTQDDIENGVDNRFGNPVHAKPSDVKAANDNIDSNRGRITSLETRTDNIENDINDIEDAIDSYSTIIDWDKSTYGNEITFTHNLGTTDYVVFMEVSKVDSNFVHPNLWWIESKQSNTCKIVIFDSVQTNFDFRATIKITVI